MPRAQSERVTHSGLAIEYIWEDLNLNQGEGEWYAIWRTGSCWAL
jgi:hypothetical protein